MFFFGGNMRFFVKFIRPLWAYPIGAIYAAAYGLLFLFSQKHRVKYYVNRARWNSITTLHGLQDYFQSNFKYKYDGPRGIIDHHNIGIEFFMHGGDCDDMAFWACKKLKSLGIPASVCFIYGNGVKNWHFDCYIITLKRFFNYGDLTEVASYQAEYGWKNTPKIVSLV